MRDWKKKNPDYNTQWFAANPEKVSEYNRKQYEKNCEERKAYQRNWQKETLASAGQQRQARESDKAADATVGRP